MNANGSDTDLARATGLLVIEVVNSNPNGDPDNESDPRTRVGDWEEISPVSFKRKLRDLVEQKDGPVWQEIAAGFNPALKPEEFDILEKRGRDRDKIKSEIGDGEQVHVAKCAAELRLACAVVLRKTKIVLDGPEAAQELKRPDGVIANGHTGAGDSIPADVQVDRKSVV